MKINENEREKNGWKILTQKVRVLNVCSWMTNNGKQYCVAYDGFSVIEIIPRDNFSYAFCLFCKSEGNKLINFY